MKAPQNSYLITDDEIERIGDLVSALQLALLEILGSRPIRDHRMERTEHQQEYDELLMPHLYPEKDPRQDEFDF